MLKNHVKNYASHITNLATTTALTAFGNKTPNVSNVVKKTDHNTKISKIENTITTDHDLDKYITTQQFNIRKSCYRVKTSKFSEQK